MKNLTNVRTFVQFSQYGEVQQYEVCSNKLQALNIIKFAYGVKSVSVLTEYTVDNYLVIGTVSKLN